MSELPRNPFELAFQKTKLDQQNLHRRRRPIPIQNSQQLDSPNQTSYRRHRRRRHRKELNTLSNSNGQNHNHHHNHHHHNHLNHHHHHDRKRKEVDTLSSGFSAWQRRRAQQSNEPSPIVELDNNHDDAISVSSSEESSTADCESEQIDLLIQLSTDTDQFDTLKSHFKKMKVKNQDYDKKLFYVQK